MIECIVLNKDKKVHERFIKNKGFRPLDGWERLKNGNFVKYLDDPRWIRAEEERDAFRNSQHSLHKEPLQNRYIPNQKNSGPTLVQTRPLSDKKMTVNEFCKHFDFKTLKHSPKQCILTMARLKSNKNNIMFFQAGKLYHTVLIDIHNKNISIWESSAYRVNPDVLLFDMII